jgi:hypothetical protein
MFWTTLKYTTCTKARLRRRKLLQTQASFGGSVWECDRLCTYHSADGNLPVSQLCISSFGVVHTTPEQQNLTQSQEQHPHGNQQFNINFIAIYILAPFFRVFFFFFFFVGGGGAVVGISPILAENDYKYLNHSTVQKDKMIRELCALMWRFYLIFARWTRNRKMTPVNVTSTYKI